MRAPLWLETVLCCIALPFAASAFWAPERAPLGNFDKREPRSLSSPELSDRSRAANRLLSSIARLQLDFDPITGSPSEVSSPMEFLTGPQGRGKVVSPEAWSGIEPTDPHGAVKAFLAEHAELFGYGASILDSAEIQRQFVTAHNGLRTVVWQQHWQGVPVFEALLIAHTTRKGELVNIGSRFVPDLLQAVERGAPQHSTTLATPPIAAAEAVAWAATSLGEKASSKDIQAAAVVPSAKEETNRKSQNFFAEFLIGTACARLVWLPLDRDRIRLCWDVILTSRSRGEMFEVLVDSIDGQVWLRRCLTAYLSDASYNVFTGDSPSPWSPGHASPLTNQPPVIERALVTWSAMDTNASPEGWLPDGTNETAGNNVDAHTDRNDDNLPDLPRPQGSPNRVFDFALDLTLAPENHSAASVAQLFYTCNWAHDRFYQLGFTEAAGNFQVDNFGRGGMANDALQAQAQDGGGANNANMSTPPDGMEPRLQVYLFDGPEPDRDGSLDAEIVLHEITHGVSWRRVGGGVGLTALQSQGLGEGWSDFYALALLSQGSDDPDACFASAAYSTYLLAPGFDQNYYYGIRRYPYSTDLGKNPLTFRDIDPGQASTHPDVPRSALIGNSANQVHNMGEVWCVALWETRARLIHKHGFEAGNRLSLELVSDGMNLSPGNPNFIQARNAILQADLVNHAGENASELWAAFAKRGLGLSAQSPPSTTTSGIVEAFDVPDSLIITPHDVVTTAATGGPFSPNPLQFSLANSSSSALSWSMASTSIWLRLSCNTGTLEAGISTNTTVQVTPAASTLGLGTYRCEIWFTNNTSGVAQRREVRLQVVGRAMADSFDPGINLAQWSALGGAVGSTVVATNHGGFTSSPNSLWFSDRGTRHATTMPIDTSMGGTIWFSLRLADGTGEWERVDLPGEGVVLEVSTNATLTWIPLGAYDKPSHYLWSNICMVLPEFARATAALFRWRQLSHSGAGYDHWAVDNVCIDAEPAPARILTQPVSATAFPGAPAEFNVLAAGTVPLQYQWSHNGTEVAGETSSSLTISAVSPSDAGEYAVSVSNALGGQVSAPATLRVLGTGGEEFKISALLTNNTRIVEHEELTGDDRGGIAVSGSSVFYSGDFSTARFSAENVSGGTAVGWICDSLCSDLGTEQIYALANGTNLLRGSGGTVTALVALDESTLQPTGAVVPLAQPVTLPVDSGIFSGVGRVVLWDGERAYDVKLPSGEVLELGEVKLPEHNVTENWAFWGVAEFWDGSVQVVYVTRNSLVVRTRIPDGVTSVISRFSNLSDMACITVSLRHGRWYFHHEGGSQFGGVNETIGCADAVFELGTPGNTPPGIYSQPSSRSILLGSSTVFTVGASGTPPLHYLWRLDGVEIAGATDSVLRLERPGVNQSGDYSVVISNAFGAVTSARASLNVVDVIAWGAGTNSANSPHVGQSSVPADVSRVRDVAGGGYHSLALKRNGKVVAWGAGKASVQTPNLGQSAVPGSLSDVVQTAAGLYHSVALRADGTVHAWGAGSNYVSSPHYGQSMVPVGLSNVVAVAAGDYHSVALKSDGRPVVWGYSAFPVANVPAAATNLIAISSRGNHVVGLRQDGSLIRWGNNTSVPSALSNLVAVAAGTTHLLALRSDGTVLCWGSQTYVPPGLSDVVEIAAGTDFNLALREDGTVVTWGATNAYGLGRIPAGLTNVASIDCGMYHSLAVLGDGSPVFKVQPFSRSVYAGTSVSFVPLLVATPSVLYQWQCNGMDLPGATNRVLELVRVRASDAGAYQLVAVNAAGANTSVVAHLTVTLPEGMPIIHLHPQSQVVGAGGEIFLSVGAGGSSPLNYQWRKDGTNLPGAVTPNLSLAPATRQHSGNYGVMISNSVGEAASSNAVVSVLVPQRLTLLATSGDSIMIGSADSDGGTLQEADLVNFVAEVSTDLVDWVVLPDSLSLTNGGLLLKDAMPANQAARFYRIRER